MSNTRPQRKATQRLYANDGAPTDSDVEMSEGEQQATRRRNGVNKGKGKGKTTKPTPKRAAHVASDDEEQDELESDVEQPTPAKKRKTTNKKQQRKSKQKTGKLELITTLPVELLAEISTHLTPGDLLALSLTSKAFRSLVLSPSSRSLWKAARRSVGLPDLTSGDLTEQQYASLIYSTRCQMCQRGNAQSVDFYLRKRLCNPCRKQHWIKVDSALLKLHPTLHKDVVDACLTTNYTPSQTTTMWPGSKNYAFLPDVQDISSKLRELEEEDAIDLEYKSLGYSLASEVGNSPGRSNRWHRTRTSSAANDDSKDDGSEGDDSEDDDRASDSRSAGGDDQEGGTRVERFLKERKVLRSSAIKDAKLLTPAYRKLKMLTKVEKTTIKRDEQTEGWSRRRAIEAKVLALDEGYTRNDFAGAWYKSKITTSAEPLTDEVWDEIKPKVIKLLARIKAQQEQAEVINDQQTRQRALRPRYDKLRETQPNDDARASLPLFADFLELESVKPFWESEDADSMDDDAWQENLEGLLEEIDDYRLSVRLHAVKTILNATTEIAEEDLTGDADEFGPEQYDDDFLERPTSFLVCTLPDCRRKGSLRTSPRPTFFGSLADLFKHQHECHPSFTFTNKQLAQRSKNGVVGHFALPPAVVSALSAVVEIGELEDETVTITELNKVTSSWESIAGSYRVKRQTYSWLHYENSPSRKRDYYADWRKLIEGVIKQNEKATRSKRPLEVPTIALRGRQIDKEERARERKNKNKKSKKRGPHPWDYSDDE